MKLIILAIAAWILTGLIAVLGVTAGATIWFDVALFLSFMTSIAFTVRAAHSTARRNAH